MMVVVIGGSGQGPEFVVSGGAAATRKTNAGHVLTIEPRPALVGAPVAMSDLEDWANALRKAERAARRRDHAQRRQRPGEAGDAGEGRAEAARAEDAYSSGVRCNGTGGFRLSTSPASSISSPDCSRCCTTRSASCWPAASGACCVIFKPAPHFSAAGFPWLQVQGFPNQQTGTEAARLGDKNGYLANSSTLARRSAAAVATGGS